MSRYECPRCEKVCFTTDPPHLCDDVKKRHERREKMRAAVYDIIALGPRGRMFDDIADEVVGTLLQMGARDF